MLKQVHIKNFKSIAGAVVDLGGFTALVGANGAGKSNFVDALRFVTDSLTVSPDYAIRNRGGIDVVRMKSTGHPANFGFRIRMELEPGLTDYSFEIKAEKYGRFSVKRERFISNSARFEVNDGVLVSETGAGSIEQDRLALPALSGFPEFRPAYDAMANFRFYAPVSDKIRQVQEPDQGETLQSDGGNSAAILREIRRRDAAKYDRVRKYLAQIVPNVKDVDYAKAGPKETIAFYQDVGAASPWEFGAVSMSDGTLRALGVLLAVFQMNTPTLTVIEEPEATVHPAALEVLLDLLLEGSEISQMVVTTHSPELLNHKSVDDEAIRVVDSDRGKTRIGPMSAGAKRVLAARLASPGEMLLQNELEIDREHKRKASLFGSARAA